MVIANNLRFEASHLLPETYKMLWEPELGYPDIGHFSMGILKAIIPHVVHSIRPVCGVDLGDPDFYQFLSFHIRVSLGDRYFHHVFF